MNMNSKKSPVIKNAGELEILPTDFETVIDSKSIIDARRVFVEDMKEARAFINAYGFDPDDRQDSIAMSNIKNQAIAYVENVLLPYKRITQIPTKYINMSIEEYLLDASRVDSDGWSNWSCLLLKIIHCATHVLYTHDVEAHAAALATIRSRFLPYISEIDNQQWIGDARCKIPLIAFDIKDRKDFSRTMTKLLHKPGNLAFEIFDRLGVRFVVYDIFSVLLLVKFLRSRNIIMYANNLPERSRNSLVDREEFQSLYTDQESESTSELAAMDQSRNTVRPEKNPFSDQEFKVLQFTERLMVKLANGRRTFFPCEIQILDKNSWDKTRVGDASHIAYERRQINSVRRRVFGTMSPRSP